MRRECQWKGFFHRTLRRSCCAWSNDGSCQACNDATPVSAVWLIRCDGDETVMATAMDSARTTKSRSMSMSRAIGVALLMLLHPVLWQKIFLSTIETSNRTDVQFSFAIVRRHGTAFYGGAPITGSRMQARVVWSCWLLHNKDAISHMEP
jgi:hypothetical protein